MATPSIREHTDAILDALGDAGITAGDGTGEGLALPYVVVYRVGGSRDGEAAAPEDRAELIYQLTCVGAIRKQAEWLQDEAEGALRSMSVAGRAVEVRLDSDGSVSRDDDLSPPLFYATPRYRIWTTPA